MPVRNIEKQGDWKIINRKSVSSATTDFTCASIGIKGIWAKMYFNTSNELQYPCRRISMTSASEKGFHPLRQSIESSKCWTAEGLISNQESTGLNKQYVG